MLSTLSRKHLSLHLSSLIGFPMLWTMLLLQSSPLLTKIMKFIQLPFTLVLLLWQSWTITHMTRNCLPSSKLLRFGNIIWKVWPIPLMLLQIIRILSIFLLPRYWPRGKHSSPSTSPSSTLLSGSTLVISAQNWMLSLDNGISILKRGILATSQSINSHNFKPIFTQEQLAASVWAIVLLFPSLCTATVIDLDTLHQDILLALLSDLIATRWSMDPNGLLLLNNRIHVLSAGNLCTCVLQYNHDYILARHFGQNKTLELVCYGYSWPSLHANV